jgi:hypothetical protein
MEKKIILIISSVLLVSSLVLAGQDTIGVKSSSKSAPSFDRTHMIAASATFSPGIFLHNGISSNYLHGFLEYFPESNVSLKGEGYVFLPPSSGKYHPLDQNSTLLFGGLYHFTKNGAFDPYLGLQPGLAFVTSYPNGIDYPIFVSIQAREVVPLITVSAGINYYVNRYFHFFGSIRYLYGQGAQSVAYFTQLSELRLSFGLGFNLAKKSCDTCPAF